MDIKGLLLLMVVASLMLQCDYVKAEGNTCTSNKAEIRKMEKDFAKVIFSTWRKAGNTGDPQKLWQAAEFSAYWILRDNNSICKYR